MSNGRPSSQGCYLAIDIGGTNFRAAVLQRGSQSSQRIILFSKPHGKDLGTLKRLTEEAVDKSSETCSSLLAVVVAAAGPMTGKDTVQLTNWPGQPRIEVAHDDSFQFDCPGNVNAVVTFPAKSARIVNDLVAAVYGLVGVLGGDPLLPTCCPPLNPKPKGTEEEEDAEEKVPADRRLVLIMPGTGLGTAALLRAMDSNGNPVFTALPSELQHSEITPLDEAHARLIERWKAETGACRLRWEDFISGKGLETIHRLLGGDGGLNAAAIAEQARAGCKGVSVESLTLYYRCIARYAQVAALAYQPTDGVFLGGGTTRENKRFICERAGHLMWWFLENPSRLHHEFLMNTAVHLVLDELNLPGALYIAQHKGP